MSKRRKLGPGLRARNASGPRYAEADPEEVEPALRLTRVDRQPEGFPGGLEGRTWEEVRPTLPWTAGDLFDADVEMESPGKAPLPMRVVAICIDPGPPPYCESFVTNVHRDGCSAEKVVATYMEHGPPLTKEERRGVRGVALFGGWSDGGKEGQP